MNTSLNRIIYTDEETYTSTAYYFDNRPRKKDDLMVIQLTIEGTGFIEINGHRHYAKKDQALIFLHGEDSSYGYPPDCSGPYRLRFLTFAGKAVAPPFRTLQDRFGPILQMPRGSRSRRLFEAIGKGFRDSTMRDRYEESIRLYELVLVLLREQSVKFHKMDPAGALHEHMQNNFHNPLSIKEFAHEIGISREALSRKFKDTYGLGPATLLRRLRMDHARALLLSTSLPVSEVGLLCGYPDLNAFSRAYRQTFRESARKSRKLN